MSRVLRYLKLLLGRKFATEIGSILQMPDTMSHVFGQSACHNPYYDKSLFKRPLDTLINRLYPSQLKEAKYLSSHQGFCQM